MDKKILGIDKKEYGHHQFHHYSMEAPHSISPAHPYNKTVISMVV